MLLILLAFVLFFVSTAWGNDILGDLSGKVTDKENGKPLAAAIVTLNRMGKTVTGTTDTNGSFIFLDLEPGTYSLKIEQEGYQSTTLSDVWITANSTSFQTVQLSPTPEATEKVVKVVAKMYNQTVDPKQSMTLYGFSEHNLNDFLPGPASLNTNTILEMLPGVQTYAGAGGYALSLPGGPHIRGGTGLGTVYALDGIPLNNNTLFNDTGNVGLTTGLSNFQFFPGVYPVEYGNGIDGYQNTVVPEGFGELHGRAQVSYGFGLDPGENSPIFSANPTTGAIGNVVGTSTIRPANPNDVNLRIEGQLEKFHYFFNAVEQDGGQSGYENSAAAAALTYSGVGGTVYRQVNRDGLMKLNYDLSDHDELETLFAYGTSSPSPEFEAAINNGNQATFQPVSPFFFHRYDIESLEVSHHFSSDKEMLLRIWQFNSNPDQYIPTAADGYFVQNDIARSTGVRLEYKSQLNDQNKISVGGQYIYTTDFQEMSPIAPNPFAAVLGNADFAGANNQNPSVWLSDEWSPTPRLDFNIGVRWDEMIYQAPSFFRGISNPSQRASVCDARLLRFFAGRHS